LGGQHTLSAAPETTTTPLHTQFQDWMVGNPLARVSTNL
jgi:hypothetical protein